MFTARFEADSSADWAVAYLLLKSVRRPLVGLLGELQLGLGVVELGAIDRIVQGEERRPLLDRLAFLEVDLLEAARESPS